MNPFDRVATTSAKNRRKQLERTLEMKGKKSKLKDRRDKRRFGSLNNSTELTHGGKPIDFDNLEDIESESDDEMIDMNDPNIQRKETLNEVIAKHKLEKSKKQQDKRTLTTMVKRLDDDFKEVKRHVKDPQYEPQSADEYDMVMQRLVGDRRAMAVERTKSITELVMEEAKKIKSSNPDTVQSDDEVSETKNLEITYSHDGQGTFTGTVNKDVTLSNPNNDLGSDASSNESDEMSEISETDVQLDNPFENEPILDGDFPQSFSSFIRLVDKSENVSAYIRKCRILHFTSPDHLKRLLHYLLCLVAYHSDAVSLMSDIYPHLFSLIYDYQLETGIRLEAIFTKMLTIEGNLSSVLTDNVLMIFKICSIVFHKDSTCMSAIFCIIGKYLDSPVTSEHCIQQGIKALKLVSSYCNSHFIYCPEIYTFGLRFIKTLHGLDSLVLGSLACFEFTDIIEYEESINELFSDIAKEHPCYELYYSMLPAFKGKLESFVKQPLTLQVHKKQLLNMQTPVFGNLNKATSDTTKLKKRLKNESKSLLRHIRKDQQFINGKKVADIKKKDKEYKTFINKITADLGREAGEFKNSK